MWIFFVDMYVSQQWVMGGFECTAIKKKYSYGNFNNDYKLMFKKLVLHIYSMHLKFKSFKCSFFNMPFFTHTNL